MQSSVEPAIHASRSGLARLSVTQFHRMIEAGILPEGAAVELIDGVLVRRDASDAGGDPMTHGPKHAYFLQRVVQWLDRNLAGSSHHLRQQLPLSLATSEPEPDVAVVRGGLDDYRDRHPGGTDCVAVIEVADSSLEYDRAVKGPIYAAAGVATYLIMNVTDQVVELHEAPIAAERRYARRSVHGAGATLTLVITPELRVELDVSALFG